MTGADAVDGDGQGAVYQLQQSLWLFELYTAAWMWNLNGVPHDDSSTEFYSMLESQNIGVFFSPFSFQKFPLFLALRRKLCTHKIRRCTPELLLHPLPFVLQQISPFFLGWGIKPRDKDLVVNESRDSVPLSKHIRKVPRSKAHLKW